MKDSTFRIPVKFISGQWEFFYGGPLAIQDQAMADLIIEKSCIKNDLEGKSFLKQLVRKSQHKILEENTELMVALSIRQDTETNIKNELIEIEYNKVDTSFHSSFRSPYTKFASVIIGKPNPSQSKMPEFKDGGGLWLHLQGTQPKGVISSSIIVPSLGEKDQCRSLNHAFTRLSEKFEPWRISHTGNIYDCFLYKERDGTWTPLSVLRDAEIARDEQVLIKEKWAEILTVLNV